MAFVKRHRARLNDALALAAVMAVGVFLALEFDLKSVVLGTSPTDPPALKLEELLALATVLLLGLLVLVWRFMGAQRREMVRRIEAERRARELSLHDPLTSLPNRRRFNDELKVAVASPPPLGARHGVFVLDLNGFKGVNDVYGHGAGDEVLIEVAIRLRRSVRETDLVVRLGGDEFAILARHLSGTEAANSIALRIIEAMSVPVVVGGIQHRVGVAIGVALFPQDGEDPAELQRKADIAMYLAKAERKSAVRYFQPEMDASVRERDQIQRDLQAAIENGDVQPFFQPLVDLRTDRVVAFEALARWTHPDLGKIPPDRFIPVAEATGLMNMMTDHLLRKASATAAAWPSDVTLSFNISPSQLKDETLGLRILAILAEAGLSPGRLEIELTESAVVNDLASAQGVMSALRDAGVRIALDDFGTGYSSLFHLRHFKVDKIKIDRSFVAGMLQEAETATLVKALLGLGHGLGLTVTAEGIEDADQAKSLVEQGCDQGQGYLYSVPVCAEDAAALLSGSKGIAVRA